MDKILQQRSLFERCEGRNVRTHQNHSLLVETTESESVNSRFLQHENILLAASPSDANGPDCKPTSIYPLSLLMTTSQKSSSSEKARWILMPRSKAADATFHPLVLVLDGMMHILGRYIVCLHKLPVFFCTWTCIERMRL